MGLRVCIAALMYGLTIGIVAIISFYYGGFPSG